MRGSRARPGRNRRRGRGDRRRCAAGTAASRRTAVTASGLVTALIAALALLLAGCADPGPAGAPGGSTASTGGDGTDSTSGSPQQELAGRTFLSTSVTGHELVEGSGIRLTFEEDQLTANAGCNTLSGSYRLADGVVTVANMGGTEMGCDQALMDQDSWLADLLGSGVAADLQGDVLTLTGQGVTVQLTDRRVADPDRPLEGTRWVVNGIITGNGDSASVSSVPQGITATLRIADGKVHLFDGMNDYDGPVDPDGTITIGPDSVQINGDVAGSGVGCVSGDVCSVDMSLLTQDFDYTITAGQLTVTGTGQYAGHGLMFVAEDGAPSTVVPPGSTGGSGSSGAGGDAVTTRRPSDETGDGASPAESVPGVDPGSEPDLTSRANPGMSLPGAHDSVPPQPSPAGASGTPER